jgi:hypothetical protein
MLYIIICLLYSFIRISTDSDEHCVLRSVLRPNPLRRSADVLLTLLRIDHTPPHSRLLRHLRAFGRLTIFRLVSPAIHEHMLATGVMNI